MMEQLTNERGIHGAKHIARLSKRAAALEARFIASPNQVDFDDERAELKSLRWAIDQLRSGELTSPEYISRLRGVMGEVVEPTLICTRCGVDRYKVVCPNEFYPMSCPVMGQALRAASPVAGEGNEMDILRAENAALLKLSMNLEEHPDDYNGPCMCKTCMSYDGGDAADAG